MRIDTVMRVFPTVGHDHCSDDYGISIRVLLAGMAMHGLLTSGRNASSIDTLVKDSYIYADALIKGDEE